MPVRRGLVENRHGLLADACMTLADKAYDEEGFVKWRRETMRIIWRVISSHMYSTVMDPAGLYHANV